MTASNVAVDALVAGAVAGEILCCLGVAAARTPFDRLHYAAAAGTVPAVLVAAAVWVAEGPTQPSVNAVVIALVLLFGNPALVTATARAARLSRYGSIRPLPEEKSR